MKWNKKEYNKYLNKLKENSNEKYRLFHSKLCQTKYPILGINTPKVKDIAKEILKEGDIENFLSLQTNTYYEELLLEGQIISKIKSEELFFKYFNQYILKIDNWALCDTFCSSIKIIRKYSDKYFDLAEDLALNEEEFISRVGLVMILDHFIQEENLPKIFNILNKISSDKYYINMAEAWLVCEMYIKYPKETLKYIKKNNLNKFTINKAISKIHDSYRVSSADKIYLNTLKRL